MRIKELVQLKEENARLLNEITIYDQSMDELNRRSDIQAAINEILNISLLALPLEEQMEKVLLLVLRIPWLALKEKGCIFLADKEGLGLDMVAHYNLGDPLLKMCNKVMFGTCLCGIAAVEQTLVFRNCIDHDHHNMPEGIQPHGHYNIPIVSNGKTLGVLNLYVKHGHQQDPLELNFLNACSQALAGMIERKIIEKELHRLSYLDDLTGVANRRKFMEFLTESLKFSSSVDRLSAVLFMDLDFFKAINDTYGHEYGDLILIEAAQRMQDCIRATDLVARLGGDEFVILLEMIATAEEAIEIAEKLIQVISSTYIIKGKTLSIGVSIGISLYPEHDISSEGLLKKADTALYGAKEERGRAVLYHASHDVLALILNRREFEEKLQIILDTAKKQSIQYYFCFYNLDQFKVINDSCGHLAGDEFLKQLAILTYKTIQEGDSLARFDGDKFGILMEHCSLVQAKESAEIIRSMIEGFQFFWKDKIFSVSVSVGLVCIDQHSTDIDEAFKQADAACFAAKKAGRNRIIIYHENDTSVSNRKNELNWANKTIEAINEGRLSLFAQAIVPITETNKKIRYELLIRQTALDGNIISPAQFLPALERYNMASKLDLWVINEAYQFMKEHAEILDEIEYFAINLSGQSFSNIKIQTFIVELLASNQVPPNKIVFEITETSAVDNINETIHFITLLKKHGCRFALDDFGSGMSSFAYLKKLPVDFLKIDGLFVKDIVNDPIDYAMVKSINEVGHIMGLETIAEFVENDDILEKLKAINVDCGQGYGLSKPLPLCEIFNAKD